MTQPDPAKTASLNEDFLFALLREAGPSGLERRPADVWKREAASFARVSEDHYGNVYAELGPEDAPAIALMGHLDEIGLIVSHVGDEGFLAVLPVGGWDPQVLVGQRIRVLAPGGDLIGVIGKKAIHVMEAEERTKASKIEDLWIDLGLSKEEVQAQVPVGTYAVIEQGPIRVGDKIVSRALDNRVGRLSCLRRCGPCKVPSSSTASSPWAPARRKLACSGHRSAATRSIRCRASP